MEQNLFNQSKETQISIFDFETQQVRTVIIDNEIWFVASDVTKILGYTNGRLAIQQHCNNMQKKCIILTKGGNQELSIINECSVYELIIKTRNITTHQKEKLLNKLNKKYIPIAKEYRESIALNVIEQLIGRPLYRQFRVLNYRLDGYDPIDKIAYEIDEEHHESQKVQDAKRQEEIEHVLGCTFKRIKV